MNRQDHELAAHDPWLRRLARRLVRSRTRADDLVQDTYLTALRNPPPEVQLRPWLHGVMRKLAWGQVRGDQRRSQREDSFVRLAPAVTLPDVLPDHGVDRERLGEAVARLPEPFQSTIIQRFFEGQSCAEIARRERVPAGTVRWRQSRGLELLRDGLAPPRRRYGIWALPFLGAGQQLVARCWQAIVARLGGSKAAWLLLACAALLYAIIGGRSPHSLVADQDTRHGHVGFGDAAAALATSFALAGGDSPGVSRLRPDGAAAGTANGVRAFATSRAAARVAREPWRAALDRALDNHQDDCVWDPARGRVCRGAGGAASDPLCALIRQQIAATQAIALSSPMGQRMQENVLLASRARAQRLGCPIDGGDAARASDKRRAAPGPTKPTDASKPPEPPSEPTTSEPTTTSTPDAPALVLPPACTTGDDGLGDQCVVCPGLAPMCDTTKCWSQEIATGFGCMLCLDDGGLPSADCSPPASTGCHSEVSALGRVCTTCDGQPPECLPAECGPDDNGCLRCIDPKDHSATTCKLDASLWSAGGNASDTRYGSCNRGASGMTCHYAGLQSCVVNEWSTGHSIMCLYPDESGSGSSMDSSEPLPDPFADRPKTLPPPGQCVIEHGLDGAVTCASCTRPDLSATTSCR